MVHIKSTISAVSVQRPTYQEGSAVGVLVRVPGAASGGFRRVPAAARGALRQQGEGVRFGGLRLQVLIITLRQTTTKRRSNQIVSDN